MPNKRTVYLEILGYSSSPLPDFLYQELLTQGSRPVPGGTSQSSVNVTEVERGARRMPLHWLTAHGPQIGAGSLVEALLRGAEISLLQPSPLPPEAEARLRD